MAEIVDLNAYRAAPVDDEISTEALDEEKFLLDEGLELLAAYRGIREKDVRLSILALARSLGSRRS